MYKKGRKEEGRTQKDVGRKEGKKEGRKEGKKDVELRKAIEGKEERTRKKGDGRTEGKM